MAGQIVGFSFESPLFAQEALLAALRLQDSGMLAIHDAVFISRDRDGAITVTETTDPTPVAAAVPTSLFGALIGAIVGGPIGFLIGGIAGGGAGAFAAKLIDTGIPDDIVAQLRGRTRPGRTVLALLVDDVSAEAVIGELHRFQGAEIVYTDLPPAAVEVVRQALHP